MGGKQLCEESPVRMKYAVASETSAARLPSDPRVASVCRPRDIFPFRLTRPNSSSHTPRPKLVLIHLRCYMIDAFPLTVMMLSLAVPQTSRLKTRRSPNLSTDFTTTALNSQPAAPRSRRRARPLASRASVWTPPLFRKAATVYRLISVSFRTFLCLLQFGLRASALRFHCYLHCAPPSRALTFLAFFLSSLCSFSSETHGFTNRVSKTATSAGCHS